MNNLLAMYLISLVGRPYRWGGDDPMQGFDCSGLALEILNAFGFNLPDQTSHDLYQWCKKNSFETSSRLGSLCFYGSPAKITHVAIALNDSIMIEAGGGDSRTTSLEAAIKQNAFIRIRPIKRRRDLVAIYYPEYPLKWQLP